MRKSLSQRTLAVHPPGVSELGKSLSPPIHQTTTFRLDSAAEGARLSEETHPTELYTRWGNPTTRILERAVAELEGAQEGLATGSGMGAISAAVLTFVRGGDHVVAGKTLYAATSELFTRVLPAYGVTATLVDPSDPANFERALERNTKLVYVESPANPTMSMTDIRAVARIARSRRIPVLADNTFATPFNQNPVSLGATAVVHSATKYIGGHTDVTAGMIVGSRAFIRKAWYTLKVFGPTLSPFDSWLLVRGLRTFALRMERHNGNALELARFLESHPKVRRVHYPGLRSHPDHAVARRQMRGGFGGMLALEIRGGYRAAKRFVESVRVAVLAVSLGGVETLVEHPASMTHGPLSPEDRKRAGISEGLVRVSVGIEDIEDLRADFDQALRKG
jgi:methionine-gamma-lyase